MRTLSIFAMVVGITLTICSCGSMKRWQSDVLINEAGQKFGAGDFKENVRLLKRAADIDPTYPRAWWKLCEGYQLTKELDLAIAACQRNVGLDPTGLSYNSLGLAYDTKKDYDHAAQAYQKAVADSNIPQIHFNFVWALLRLKQYEKIPPAAQRLIESTTDSSEITFGFEAIGIAYKNLGQPTKARDAFQKAHVQSCEMTIQSKDDLALSCQS